MDCESETIRPIASVTKLMTALVVLDSEQSMTEKLNFRGFNKRNLTREEVLQLMLVRSDNRAAEILAKNYPGGRPAFIKEMNLKAASLGMSRTRYDDPSGISSNNISTARDLTRLLVHSYSYAPVRDITSKASYNVDVESKKRKHKTVTVNNTNRNLLTEFNEIEISKTGTTSAAGKCLAMVVSRNGSHYVVVILGERNKKSIENVSRKILVTL
jgi:D-alanyl-D-alanine endopeptidase (penicillin-binding protein 7)